MICIKKIIFLVFCIFLVSCSKRAVENPFDSSDSLTGTYVCGEKEFTITVEKCADSVRVTPDAPSGYSVSFSDNGAKITFNGIEFNEEASLSRFYPLFEMAFGNNTVFNENSVNHVDGYIFKDFR